ncbi:hypothetical protein NL676_027060 [Syzygium grande]|nr:hypothetical protein NL676_027060 [Syzygium grande]
MSPPDSDLRKTEESVTPPSSLLPPSLPGWEGRVKVKPPASHPPLPGATCRDLRGRRGGARGTRFQVSHYVGGGGRAGHRNAPRVSGRPGQRLAAVLGR